MAPSSSLDRLFSRELVKSYDMQQFEAITMGGPKGVEEGTMNATLILLELSQTTLNRIPPMSFRKTSYLTHFSATATGFTFNP